MAKKAVTDVENKIKKIRANMLTESADLEERVEIAKEQMKIANKAMDDATTCGDVKAYQKAKAECRDSGDAIEMYTKRIEMLKSRPLISSEEYEKGISLIMDALKEVSDDAKKQIRSHVEQIKAIAADCSAEITRGNEVLQQWQCDIFREKANSFTQKKFGDYFVVQFAEYILGSGFYKTMTNAER